MDNIKKAKILSNEMIKIGNLANRQTICILTNMDEPLGYAIGNTLEVIEAINFLKGKMPKDLKEVVLELGAYMIKLAGKGNDLEKNKKKLLEAIENQKAYNKFIELVKNQGGDITYIENPNKFTKSKFIEKIYSKKNGYISSIDAKKVGNLSMFLGAGRNKKEDSINPNVGIVLNKKVGDKVAKDDLLAIIYLDEKEKCEESKKRLEEIIQISEEQVPVPKTILDVIE